MAPSAPPPKVLLLGEANFSFALALCNLLEKGDQGAALRYLRLGERCSEAVVVATSLEAPEAEVVRKYPETAGIFQRLRASCSGRHSVQHGVNAWDLHSSFGEAKWEVIAWNHPHLGTEDCRLHKFLLAHFLHAASEALIEGGHVVLSLVEGQAARWELENQARRTGFQVLSCEPFAACDFPGYECKRNTTGKSFKNLHSQRHTTDVMQSWSYCLGRAALDGVPMTVSVCASAASDAGAVKVKGRRRRFGDADPTTSRPGAQTAVCEICGKAFSCAQGLKTHKRQVHELCKYGDAWQPEGGKELTCKDCGKSFRDGEALWQHSLSVHSTAAATTGSTPHGLRGPSQVAGHLQEEVAKANSGFRPCSICGMAVAKGTPMEAHLEALKPLVDLELRCGCGRSFPEARALAQHRLFCSKDGPGRGKGLPGFLGRFCQAWCRVQPCCQRR